MKLNNRFSKLIKKLNSRRGFSLSEILICTLIMLFAGSILTSTITLAVRNYDKQVLRSKSDILCETLAYTLRDKLSGVIKRNVSVGGSTVTSLKEYYSTSSGLEDYSFKVLEGTDSEKGKIYLKYDFSSYTDSSVTEKYHLVNDAVYYHDTLYAKVKIEEKPDDGKELEFFVVQVGVYDKNHSDGAIVENNPNALSYVMFMVYPMTDVVNYVK
ncbi:MAG: hypothetical protein K6G06_06520 [Butyrivibrio sp.]|nr:hypothetical protein [Butyrivibrio sp.]